MISNRQKFASCIIDKLSVYELLKFLQYAILCCTCGNYSFLSYNNSSFDFPHLCIHKDTHTHTHTRMQNQVFNEIIRSSKDSGQIERNKQIFALP